MAFFKKKVQKLAAQNAADFLKDLQGIENHLAAVDVMPDVADRFSGYMAAHDYLQRLENKIFYRNRHAASTGTGVFGAPLMVGGMVVVGAGIMTAALLLATPILAAAAIPAGMMGLLPGIWTKNALQKRNDAILNGSLETLMDSMKKLRAYAAVKRAEILKNELPQLAASARFHELKTSFPEVKDAFANVAVKMMQEEEQSRPVPVIKIKPKT